MQNIKQSSLKGLLTSSILAMTLLGTATQVQAGIVYTTPVNGVIITKAPVYNGYGYRHGYYGASYGRGTVYNNSYRHGHYGNTYYRHGYKHGTVIHNGNVHHYRR